MTDLHLVASLPRGGAFEQREDGGVRASRQILEQEPHALAGFRFRDAYLYVQPSDDLRRRIMARIGRVGDAAETGRIFDGPPAEETTAD